MDPFGHEEYSEGEEGGFFGEFEEKEPEMMAEIGAYERAGPPGALGTSLIKSGTMAEIRKQLIKEISNPEERLRIFVDAISRKLNGEDIVRITQEDIDTMLEKIPTIPKAKYKNPSAYILGYLASRGGKKLDPSHVKKIIRTILPHLQDSGVEPADVVRYARFWTTI